MFFGKADCDILLKDNPRTTMSRIYFVSLCLAIVFSPVSSAPLKFEVFETATVIENTDEITIVNITGGTGTISFDIDDSRVEGYLETGLVRFVSDDGVDFETLPENPFNITLTLADDDTTKTKIVEVTILDANDPPSFKDYVMDGGGFSIDLWTSAGTIVGTVTASDEDVSSPNNLISYDVYVKPNNTAIPFEIDDQGVIRVAKEPGVSLGDRKVWPLVVRATDGGSPGLSGSTIVPVSVCGVCTVEGD